MLSMIFENELHQKEEEKEKLRRKEGKNRVIIKECHPLLMWWLE